MGNLTFKIIKRNLLFADTYRNVVNCNLIYLLKVWATIIIKRFG